MNGQNNAELNLFNLETEPTLIEYDKNSFISFYHFNLCDSDKSNSPDSGQIADYLFSKIKSPKIIFFLLLVDRKRKENWTEKNNYIFYQEFIEIKRKDSKNIFYSKRGCVWKKYLNRDIFLEVINQNKISPIEAVAKNRKAAIIHAETPFRLDTLDIKKPWGYEKWYTGVEKRGVVNVVDKYGKTELPYALNIFKKQILKNHQEELILLKKLIPSEKEIIGDLYYEMHEKKWEVYIVTEIDKSAWPNGEGIIKAGISPKKIDEYRKEHDKNWKLFLRKDFKKAISEYEDLRRYIDNSKNNLSKDLREKEKTLRENATSFVGDYFVKEGDIVSFPTFQIHSLQHGVKVIEFQTPHYERLILMFGQKVLTQNFWDSEEVFKKMETDIYKPPKIEILHKKKGILIERFVNFPDFTADRLFLQPKMISENFLENDYHILIIISGQATIINKFGEKIFINPEDAVFIPISMKKYTIKNSKSKPLICLKAMPK